MEVSDVVGSTRSNPRIVLARRPQGRPQPSDFTFLDDDAVAPGDGQVLVAVDHDRFDLGRIEVVDLRVNSTGSQEVIVVEGEEHSVARRMDVGLDVAVSE